VCGIAGWISYNRNLESSRSVIATMTHTLANRGPDADGLWIDGHAGLGHRRLAVIDIAGGVQPMVAKEEGQTLACLVYTGEVYNFVELRAELQSLGHHFDTRSDTEVVLRGCLQWGEKIAERLNGMFAFAVWDPRLEELFLVRDRLGVKPLFYYPTSDGVLFGSSNAHKTLRKILVEDQKLEVSSRSRAVSSSRMRACRPPSFCSRRPTRAAPTTCGSTTSTPMGGRSTTSEQRYCPMTSSDRPHTKH